MDRLTDRQGDSYIPPRTLFAGGIVRYVSTSVSHNEIWFYCKISLSIHCVPYLILSVLLIYLGMYIFMILPKRWLP